MVKIREGLPLIDGQTTSEDSASLAAQVIASQRERERQLQLTGENYLHEDVKKQLSTTKLYTEVDRSQSLNLLDPTLINISDTPIDSD